MKLIKPPKLEVYSFVLSIPLISLAFNLVFFGDRLWKDANVWLISFPLIIVIGVFSWYGHVLYSNWVEHKYPSLQQSRRRIFMKLLIPVLVMGPSVALILLLYDRFHILGYTLRISHIPRTMAIGVSVNLVFETLFEADYILSCLKQSRAEKETAGRLAINQEFDTLKSQVNPHFLFNCFNTLSSLIAVDKEKAELFLDELSKVYRYLLRNNEEGLSTLENEIRFIHSYYKLLQTRHGEAVQLNVQIDKRYNLYLIPSLTLQLLVENVVKHNALSKNKPLVIDIFTAAGNKLVVNNNLQRRTVKAPSNGVGLENIKAKYLLLKQPGFQVIEDEKNFSVVLPLIWNKSAVANATEPVVVK
jgi:two-component system, LytTR family, sensor kinase